MVHAYAVLLRLYPEAFRRRYAAEMVLDFQDALDAARAVGRVAVGACASRAIGDLAVSLVREWNIAGRLAMLAATASVTMLVWGLALRPWAWRGDIQPGPPLHARQAPPVTEVELLVLAVLALVPIVVVILVAPCLGRAPSTGTHRRDYSSQPSTCLSTPSRAPLR